MAKIAEYQHILESRSNMDVVIKKDLEAIKEEFATPRRTLIEMEKKLFTMRQPWPSRRWCSSWTGSATASFWTSPHTTATERPSRRRTFTWYRASIQTRSVFFTNTGNLHQVKAADIPLRKAEGQGHADRQLKQVRRHKRADYLSLQRGIHEGQPLPLRHEAGSREECQERNSRQNNRTVAATKLLEGDDVVSILVLGQRLRWCFRPSSGVFLRFCTGRDSRDEEEFQRRSGH